MDAFGGGILSHALVSGGAGFIGSHLVDRLLEEGWRVTVLDAFDPPETRAEKKANLAGCGAKGWCRIVEADLRDLPSLASQLEGGYDVVVHLAARAGSPHPAGEPGDVQEVNVCGTQNLLECARRWGTGQFVFASSGDVYGANPRTPWREDDTELLPVSPLAASKAAGESLGHVYSHLYGIRFVALRLFDVYGPRQRPDQCIRAMAAAMLAGRPVELPGDGSSACDYTYAGDVVDGVRAAMDYRDLGYEVINLGSGQTHTLCETERALERALGATARLEPKSLRPGEPPQRLACIGKAQRLLGYHPRVEFDEGLRRFAAWLEGTSTQSLLALHEAVQREAGIVPIASRPVSAT